MEVGAESSRRIGKCSLSITQGRGKFSERKQEVKRPTLDGQGWEPSISLALNHWNPMFGPFSAEGRREEMAPHRFHTPGLSEKQPGERMGVMTYCVLPHKAWSLASTARLLVGVVWDGYFPGITDLPPVLMYLQLCPGLLPDCQLSKTSQFCCRQTVKLVLYN